MKKTQEFRRLRRLLKAADITSLAPYMELSKRTAYDRAEHPEMLRLSEIMGIGKYFIINGEMTAEEFRKEIMEDFKF